MDYVKTLINFQFLNTQESEPQPDPAAPERLQDLGNAPGPLEDSLSTTDLMGYMETLINFQFLNAQESEPQPDPAAQERLQDLGNLAGPLTDQLSSTDVPEYLAAIAQFKLLEALEVDISRGHNLASQKRSESRESSTIQPNPMLNQPVPDDDIIENYGSELAEMLFKENQLDSEYARGYIDYVMGVRAKELPKDSIIAQVSLWLFVEHSPPKTPFPAPDDWEHAPAPPPTPFPGLKDDPTGREWKYASPTPPKGPRPLPPPFEVGRWFNVWVGNQPPEQEPGSDPSKWSQIIAQLKREGKL
jgi:hypothetical protein